MLPFILGGLGAMASLFGGKSKSGSCSSGTCGHPEHGGGGDGMGGRYHQFPRYTPQQQAALNQIFQYIPGAARNLRFAGGGIVGNPPGGNALRMPAINQLLGQLKQPSEFTFAPIAEQARAQYYGQTLPGLAERYTAMGGTGRSGAFGNLMRGQAGEFERGLASQQQQFGQQENEQALRRYSLLGDLLGRQQQTALQRYQLGTGFKLQQRGQRQQALQALLGLGTTPMTENVYQQPQPRQPGFLESALPGLANTALQYGLKSIWG